MPPRPTAGLLLLALLACGKDPQQRPDESRRPSAAAIPRPSGARDEAALDRSEADERAASGSAARAAATTSPLEQAGASRPAVLPLDPARMSAMVVRTGTASLEVDSLEAAVAGVRRLAQRLGGYVGNTALSGGREQYRHATVELKVPSDRFDDLAGGLEPLGKLEHVNVSAEDVGEEFVDVSARAENARRLEERLLTLLATRAGKLRDVLNVERELARVREEIERLDGRLRYLRTRSAVSTLTVTLHEPLPLIARPHPIREAVRRAWEVFIAVVAGVVASLGVVVPLAVGLGGAWVATRRLRRARA
jgi:hypothetical protein